MGIAWRILWNIFVTVFLTLTTQVGGLVWILSQAFCLRTSKMRIVKQFALFFILYSLSSLVLLPALAPIWNKTRITKASHLRPHSFAYIWMNRHYVHPELNAMLVDISEELQSYHPGLKLTYLDGSFPLGRGFPLLPHRSHDDGRSVDLSFIYLDEQGNPSNLRRSVSGYGIFVEPRPGESNQTQNCLDRGYRQYDFTRHLHLGELNRGAAVDDVGSAFLVKAFAKRQKVRILFIEPHLKTRWKINHPKVRYHGCATVRHDDHIHVQIKRDP